MNIQICGGSARFRAFAARLADENDTLRFCGSAAAPSWVPEEAVDTLYLLLPDYPQGGRMIEKMDFETVAKYNLLRKRGAGIYIENYAPADYHGLDAFGCFTTGRERFFYKETLFADGQMLQARGAFYLPRPFAPGLPGMEILAAVTGRPDLSALADASACDTTPVLVRYGENVFAANMNFSDFDDRFMRPRHAWKEFLIDFWSRFFRRPPEKTEQAFEAVYPETIQIRGGKNTLRQSLEAALTWHLNSGLMRSPDGKKGIFEMIRSGDLGVREDLRTDSVLMTGALFAGVGKLFDSAPRMKIGKNLAEFILARGVQEPSGFLRWYDNLRTVYGNDLGRHGLALLHLWKTTGEERFRQCAERLADAALKWLEKDGLCSGCFRLEKGYEGEENSVNPIYYGEMAAFLLKMGREQDIRAVLRLIERVDFNSLSFGHSKADVYSRALLMYACLQYSGHRDCRREIGRILDFYREVADVSGGFREEGVIDRPGNSTEAGIARGGDRDRIADMLYCNNYVLAALSVLGKNRCGCFDEPARGMLERLKKFLLNIQIRSTDPRLDGGWMRAFDMEHGEYYGLDRDLDWGPYCIMTGWTMGIIPLVFLAESGGEDFFV